jgi:hypothetical protein
MVWFAARTASWEPATLARVRAINQAFDSPYISSNGARANHGKFVHEFWPRLVALATLNVSAREVYDGWSYGGRPGSAAPRGTSATTVGCVHPARQVVRAFAVGGYIGYNVFYENTSDVIELPRGAISGQQYRHLSTVPIMVGMYRHFGGNRSGAGTHLYLGINGGVYYFYQMMDIGVLSLSTSEWLFGVAPEVGIVMTRGRTAVALQAKYHYPIPGGDGFPVRSERGFQYLSHRTRLRPSRILATSSSVVLAGVVTGPFSSRWLGWSTRLIASSDASSSRGFRRYA